jgi:hypothetical protein
MGIAAELVIGPSLICCQKFSHLLSEIRQRFRCVKEKDEPDIPLQQRIPATWPLLSSNLLEVGPTDRTNHRFIGGISALADNLGCC